MESNGSGYGWRRWENHFGEPSSCFWEGLGVFRLERLDPWGPLLLLLAWLGEWVGYLAGLGEWVLPFSTHTHTHLGNDSNNDNT